MAFLWAGAACVVNAVRCRRVHCFFTGPLYLGLGVISALIGLDVLAWRWRTVGFLFVVGTLGAFAPELVGKRYARRTTDADVDATLSTPGRSRRSPCPDP